MLKVKNVSRTFESGESTVKAVDGVSFSVPQGGFVSVVGRSGSGKSTLLALLGALDRPSKGLIEVGGQDISKINSRKLNTYRSQTIGFVFQNYHLVPNLSALENVILAMEFAGYPKHERRERASELLDKVGLDHEKQLRKPGKLSGGEQQRVAIARALANNPKLILADEPTGNLDSHTGKMVFDLLHKLSREDGVTIVVVTHDLTIAGKTDAAYTLKDGKLVDR